MFSRELERFVGEDVAGKDEEYGDHETPGIEETDVWQLDKVVVVWPGMVSIMDPVAVFRGYVLEVDKKRRKAPDSIQIRRFSDL